LHAGLGLPAGAPLVLMLARLNPQKGVADLIEAVPRVLARRPDCRFLLVGDTAPGEGGLLRDWQALARRLGVAHAIFFLGHRRDVPALLKAATLSVLPSYSEGLSNALIESMAAGVPVVSTRVGGTPELIED